LLPAVDSALLDYIQRQGRRTQAKKDKQQRKGEGMEGIDDDSDDDSDSESEGEREEAAAPKGRKAPRTKATRASDFIGEGLPSSLEDLLEDQSGRKSVLGASRSSTNASNELDEDEDYHVQVTTEGRVVLVAKESKSIQAVAGPADGMELEGEEKAANHFNKEKEEREGSKKRSREPGEEYRSKKAGGDVWKKGMLEPHAYIPLDARLLTKKNQKNAISHIGATVQNATKRRLKESRSSDPGQGGEGSFGKKKVSTMMSRNQRRAQMKGHK
jgi:ribosomal RNA-processing protein 12